MMTLEEAFKRKGEAVTQIEIWQSRLREANNYIAEYLKVQAKQVASKQQLETVPPTPDDNGEIADRL